MAENSLIAIHNLTKSYVSEAGETVILHGIDLEIKPGEFVAIMGPSGSGKSTFMNIVGCLDIPSSGSYKLQGQEVETLSNDQLAHLRNHLIGFVFQGFNLLSRATLEANVALPLIYSGMSARKRVERARFLLTQMGLSKFFGVFPNQISGGQQQRVAIARALATNPALLLADEPTGNLDTQTSQEIMKIFSDLNAKEGITIVLVTHEPDIAAYAKRLIRFVDGRVVHDAPVTDGVTG